MDQARKLKIGVVGTRRGRIMYGFGLNEETCEVVAICDNWKFGLLEAEKKLGRENIKYFTDYDEFLKCDMDVVMLANYATEHAPFAIRAMEAGKDVLSEVLPVQNPAEAVELIECIERTGRKYCYAENYCYMGAPREMRKRYLAGEIGDFEYGEGEYLHNCEPIWDDITHGDPNHWRNNMSAFFYCTHSAGPIIHMTGKRPVKVTGFEMPFNARMARMGAKAGNAAVEMVSFADGTVFKSLHGVGCSKSSVWYSVYGSKGRMESERSGPDNTKRIITNIDAVEGDSSSPKLESYIPTDELTEIAEKHGHGGSDYYCLHNAVEFFRGNTESDVVSVYEAIDMWSVGYFGYLSALAGGIPMDIPDFRDAAAREKYRNDRRCTDPKAAGDQLLPSYSKGNPIIPDQVYENVRHAWDERVKQRKEKMVDLMQSGERHQIVMRWKNDGSAPMPLDIPEGMKIVSFPDLPDATEKWLDIVQFGLSDGRQTPEYYERVMTNRQGYDEKGCFFVLVDGVPAATVTVICDHENKEGYVHMVACREEYRGRGIGTLMNKLAVSELKRNGMIGAHLVTDAYRIPAIRSYLRAGFVPDESNEEDKKRWDEVRVLLGTETE